MKPAQNGLKSSLCSKALKALADPERLRIIDCLRGGRRPVGDICRELATPIANVSHHLKQLRLAGLVASERKGRLMIYFLPPHVLREDSRTSVQILDLGCCRLELEPSPLRDVPTDARQAAIRSSGRLAPNR